MNNWYKDLSYAKCIAILKRCRTMSKAIYDYRIVQIPKPNNQDETRPLSVARPEWRVLQHQLMHILQLWLSPYIPSNQHGFQPGLGTGSAWREILIKVVGSPNIYEFDLSKFFDSVNLDYLLRLLKALGIPDNLANLIINWNRQLPTSGALAAHQHWRSDEQKAQTFYYHMTGKWLTNLTLKEIEFILKRMVELAKGNPLLLEYCYYYGVGQGSPLSPLLSTLVLIPHLLLNPSWKVIQYADDGIIYSPTEEGIRLIENGLTFPPESGIELSIKKSGWIKRDGKWLKPFTFLGITYLPLQLLTAELRALYGIKEPLAALPPALLISSVRNPKTAIRTYTTAEMLAKFQEAEFYDLLEPVAISELKSGHNHPLHLW